MSYMRRPKTTQERRWSEAYRKYTRPKRNRRNLVSAWDDIIRSDIYDRNWKRYRKTQYKPKPMESQNETI